MGENEFNEFDVHPFNVAIKLYGKYLNGKLTKIEIDQNNSAILITEDIHTKKEKTIICNLSDIVLECRIKKIPFYERYPNFPLCLSIFALIASIIMPILRKFLEGMI